MTTIYNKAVKLKKIFLNIYDLNIIFATKKSSVNKKLSAVLLNKYDSPIFFGT